MPDTIAEAVLARADVTRFLEGSHGLSSKEARTKVLGVTLGWASLNALALAIDLRRR